MTLHQGKHSHHHGEQAVTKPHARLRAVLLPAQAQACKDIRRQEASDHGLYWPLLLSVLQVGSD